MPYADAFDQREPLGKPFLGSLALHAGVAALLTVGTFISGRTLERWGDKEALGGSTMIKAVTGIPMVARQGPVNPVANDTESQVPQAPPKPKAAVREKAPEPDAIPLRGRVSKKRSPVTSTTQRYRPETETKSNQGYGTTGQAMVSPIMGQAGPGGIGIGTGSVLGDRFGAYASLLRQLIGQKWRTQDVDPRIRTAPPVIMTFIILRDGTMRDIRVKTSSGNGALDRSAERALYDVGRVPPLPAAYDRDKAEIEFWFELKR